jgi:Bacteriophage protein of unknown function (DUF646).
MSMEFTIEKADQRFGTRWRWESTATKWALETGTVLTDAIQRAAPVSDKSTSGKLRDSITFKPKISGSSATVEFTSRVPYAGYVIKGTPAHVIVPRNARVLRWQQGGQWVYRQRVNHPAHAPTVPEKAVKPLVPWVSRKMRNLVVESMGEL